MIMANCRIALLSKQLVVDWIAAGLNSLCEKSDLVHRSFLAMGNNRNLTDANDHMIWLETDIAMIFDDEDDNEVFNSFTAKVIVDVPPNMYRIMSVINCLLIILFLIVSNNF